MSNRLAALLSALLLLTASLQSATDPFTNYVDWRYHPIQMQIRDVAGLSEHIIDGKLHLRLKDFLILLLKNSTDVQLTRLDVYTAANQIVSAQAPFDPILMLGFNTLRSVSPVSFNEFGTVNTPTGGSGSTGSGGTTTGSGGSTSGTGGAPVTGTTGTGGLNQITLPETISSLSQNSVANYNQLLPTGQTLLANFSVARSSGYGLPYPALFGSLNVTIVQHLLQNRSNIQAKGPLQIARTQLLISSDRSKTTIADFVAAAARQYWTAVLARDSINVQAQNVDLARKSYDRDKQALDLGALARLDIYQSETQVAERNRDLIQARYEYKSDLDALRRLIGADLTPAMRATEIVLDDDASVLPAKSTVLPFEEALAKAMQLRPENTAAERQISVDETNARIARDSLLPQLDLTGQGGGTGPGFNQVSASSATGLPTSNPYPGLGGTLGQVLAFNYPSYGFGVQLNFPFRNSTGRANLSEALVNKARDRYQQRQTQQQIILDVRQAITALELANASIDAAVTARDFAKKNVAAEQQKYELGTITAFEVLDSQSRLASSESALLSAYVTYQQAYVAYQRATWTLLDDLGMVLEMPKTS